MKPHIFLATLIGVLPAIVACGVDPEDPIASTGQASSVHLKGGKNAEPSFIDNVLRLTGGSSLSGLGNEDLLITLDATANPDARCTNPSGANQPPGQNPASVDVTRAEPFSADGIKNGTLTFSVTTAPPPTPILGAPDCPGVNWTESIVDMAFTSATLTVEQPVGTVVLTVSCTFSAPTADGPVPAQQVSCSSL